MWPGIAFRWHLIFCQEAWQSFLLGLMVAQAGRGKQCLEGKQSNYEEKRAGAYPCHMIQPFYP